MSARPDVHFPDWNKHPLLTMTYIEERARRVVDSPAAMADFWRSVLEPAWADRIMEPVVAVVPLDGQLKTQSMVMVGFGTPAEISDALLHQLFPSLAGLGG